MTADDAFADVPTAALVVTQYESPLAIANPAGNEKHILVNAGAMKL